jgi:hypothetical protein
MDEDEFTNCPSCGRRIDPDNLRAVGMIPTGAFGSLAGNNDRTDGMQAFFRPGCFNSRDPNWKLA